MLENELEKLQGTRFQLEMNVNTLESAKMNQETMAAMKKAAGALKHIHGDLYVSFVTLPGCACSPTDV
jgi:charged multivesicular body protein 4